MSIQEAKPEDGRPCTVLLFSGGRDSTLAAIRLHKLGHRLVLVTITASHLYGILSVKRRLLELTQCLPGDTLWLQVVQPQLEAGLSYFHHRTCLPCQYAYVVTGATIARQVGATCVSLGYARYQADWPEQTTLATAELKRVLSLHGLDLLLPVYDVNSRTEAILALKQHGLSELSLEQKCSQQVSNVRLDDPTLLDQVTRWGAAIDTGLQGPPPSLEVTASMQLSEVKA